MGRDVVVGIGLGFGMAMGSKDGEGMGVRWGEGWGRGAGRCVRLRHAATGVPCSLHICQEEVSSHTSRANTCLVCARLTQFDRATHFSDDAMTDV